MATPDDACVRCAITCPNDAIEIYIDEGSLERTYDRIRANVKYYWAVGGGRDRHDLVE